MTETPVQLARRVLNTNSYLTLATADVDGRPWATPVWFADREGREFVWVSRTARRHSRNIAERAEVAIAVFDSSAPVGSAVAVYADAVATVVADDELVDALAVFGAGSRAAGLPAWSAHQVTGDAPHRLYRAVANDVWVLDEDENRVRVW